MPANAMHKPQKAHKRRIEIKACRVKLSSFEHPRWHVFFTVVTEQRQAILTQPNMRIALREAIEQVRLTRPFNIEAWVLLPDHLHAIWTLPAGDDDFSTRWKIIKQLVTRQCGAEFFDATLLNNRRKHKRQSTLWQQRFYERLIRDESDFQTHLNYIHFNPVKHGLVECVKDWQYS